MGDVYMQSNSGDVGGSGLNPIQLDTNTDDTFSITQQRTEMAILGVNVPVGNNGGQAFRSYQGLTDSNVADRFLAPYIQSLTMFNTYKLERANYTFFIGAASSSGQNYHPGVIIFCALPWTRYYSTDNNVHPVGNISVLPGCHTWVTYNHSNEDQLEEIVYANTAFQRQARISVTPSTFRTLNQQELPYQKLTSTPHHSNSTQQTDGIIPFGEELYSNSGVTMPTELDRSRHSGSPT